MLFPRAGAPPPIPPAVTVKPPPEEDIEGFANKFTRAMDDVIDSIDQTEAELGSITKAFDRMGEAVRKSVLTPIERYNEEMERLRDLLAVGAINQETFRRASERLAQELGETTFATDAINNAFDGLADGIVNALNRSESAMDSFRSVAKAFVDDLLRDFLRLVVFAPLREALLGAIGGFLGGGGSSVGLTTPITTLAGGGPISGPAIVGERGPELFVPSSAGRIVANDRLGGQTIVIDARGSNGDAAVEAAVERGIRRAAPHLINASVQRVRSGRGRNPNFFQTAVG